MKVEIDNFYPSERTFIWVFLECNAGTLSRCNRFYKLKLSNLMRSKSTLQHKDWCRSSFDLAQLSLYWQFQLMIELTSNRYSNKRLDCCPGVKSAWEDKNLTQLSFQFSLRVRRVSNWATFDKAVCLNISWISSLSRKERLLLTLSWVIHALENQ